jgi:cytochrome c1
MIRLFSAKLVSAGLVALALAGPASAAGDAPEIPRQSWTFAGFRGYFDNAQLQRGFLVYKEVCSSCHGMKRLSFRNLMEPGGPEFSEDGVKSLAATYKVVDGPNDQGKMFKRPGRLSDGIPSPFLNDNEARSANNGALPPDFSVLAKARGIEADKPFFMVPLHVVKDIATGYQEAGPDYIYALLTGYKDPPKTDKDGKPYKLADLMHYNVAYPGNQVAMTAPLSDGLVKYPKPKQGEATAAVPETVEQYARDVTAFLAWAADPKLEERKRIGMLSIAYLLITALLLYFAKKRVWSKVPH